MSSPEQDYIYISRRDILTLARGAALMPVIAAAASDRTPPQKIAKTEGISISQTAQTPKHTNEPLELPVPPPNKITRQQFVDDFPNIYARGLGPLNSKFPEPVSGEFPNPDLSFQSSGRSHVVVRFATSVRNYEALPGEVIEKHGRPREVIRIRVSDIPLNSSDFPAHTEEVTESVYEIIEGYKPRIIKSKGTVSNKIKSPLARVEFREITEEELAELNSTLRFQIEQALLNKDLAIKEQRA